MQVMLGAEGAAGRGGRVLQRLAPPPLPHRGPIVAEEHDQRSRVARHRFSPTSCAARRQALQDQLLHGLVRGQVARPELRGEVAFGGEAGQSVLAGAQPLPEDVGDAFEFCNGTQTRSQDMLSGSESSVPCPSALASPLAVDLLTGICYDVPCVREGGTLVLKLSLGDAPLAVRLFRN